MDLSPIEVNKEIPVDLRVFVSAIHKQPTEDNCDKKVVNVRILEIKIYSGRIS